MKTGIIGSVAALLASASLALGQAPAPGSTLPVEPSSAVANTGVPLVTPSSGVLDNSVIWGAGPRTSPRFWATAEYLLWWTDSGSVPALVTTGPALPITPSPGSLAAPGTVVLFGGNDSDGGPFSGGRFGFGMWCNDCQTFGVGTNFFFLGQRSNGFDAATSGAPGSGVLARPFFDTSTGLFNSQLVGYPGLAAGSVNVNGTSSLLGADFNLICNLCRSCDIPCNPCDPCAWPTRGYRVNLVAGPRYMQLDEGLGVGEVSQVALGAPVFAGSTISAFDQFDTVNRFYGAQVGIQSEWWWKRVVLNANASVALGVTHQSVDINGETTIAAPGGGVTVLPGNLLALPSNIGHYSRDQFSVVPELGFNIGYQLTSNLRLTAGYTLIYWTNVQRPGDAISTQVNSTRVPASTLAPTGPQNPLFNFNNSDFWAQGINAGLHLRF